MAAIIDDAKLFLSNKFNLALVLLLVILGLNLLFFMPESPQDYSSINKTPAGAQNASLEIEFFYYPTCPHCKMQMSFNVQMATQYEQIKFNYHNTDIAAEQELLKKMYEDRGIDSSKIGVPTTFVGEKYLIGYDSDANTGAQLEQMIKEELNISNGQNVQNATLETIFVDLPVLGKIKPAQYSLPILAMVLGLVDGFNPCAMWVLVYLISIVISLKDRSKLWLIVGSFVAASGILYFLFMTAWLNAFLFIGYFRPVTIIVGLVALGGGILSLKEFLQNPAGTLECKVTDAQDRKKTIGSINALVAAPLTLATVAGIIALAFAVNSIEFVCSAAIPAVFTQVLALSNLSGLEYYFYILVYTLFFMLDDLVIFGLAAFAISSDAGQKYAGYCHVIGGLIMLFLGIMLLFFPSMLT